MGNGVRILLLPSDRHAITSCFQPVGGINRYKLGDIAQTPITISIKPEPGRVRAVITSRSGPAEDKHKSLHQSGESGLFQLRKVIFKLTQSLFSLTSVCLRYYTLKNTFTCSMYRAPRIPIISNTFCLSLEATQTYI